MTKYQFLLSPLKYAQWMDIYAYHLEHPKKSQWQVSLAFRVSKGTVWIFFVHYLVVHYLVNF